MEVSPDSALRSHLRPSKAGFSTLVKPATENRGVVGSIPTLAIHSFIGQSGLLSGLSALEIPLQTADSGGRF
jgi:hypothetical protein